MRTRCPILLASIVATACGGDDGGTGEQGTGESGDASGESSGPPPVVDDSTGPADDGDDGMDPSTSGATTEPDPVCGNGIMEGIEQCDDNNDVPADGCEIDCTTTYDTSIWQVTHAGKAGVQEAGLVVAIDGAGNPVVVGYVSDVVGDPNVWVRKYDPDGEEIWTTVLDPSMGGEDRGWAVAIDAADNVFVTGETDVLPDSADLWVAQLSPDGMLGWTDTVDGPDMNDDGGRGIAVDSMGNVGVTGFVRIANNDNDIFVGMWSPDGTALWSEVIAGPDALDDRGSGAAFDSTDALVVS